MFGYMKKKAQTEYDSWKAELFQQGNKEISAYECSYHCAMEAKKVELAKLDALIEAKKEILGQDKAMYEIMSKEKDKMIADLKTVIENLSRPSVVAK